MVENALLISEKNEKVKLIETLRRRIVHEGVLVK